jgi:RNA polymerase sigma-70 factor, ECF subfamily
MTQALRMTLIKTGIDPDQALLQRIAGGDDDALRSLYAAHGRSMYAYALRLTGDPSSAEEAVQQSLVAIWQGAGHYRGDGRIITWLLGIVYHKSLNLLRGRDQVSLEELLVPLKAGEEPPGRQVEALDRQRMIRSGLEQLPIEQRSVLELVFFHHLSMEETGRVLDCPTGTVKSRLFAAKNSLKGVLTRQGYRLEDLL